MGIVHKPRLPMYCSTDRLFSSLICSEVMGRDQFFQLLKFQHFADNSAYDVSDPNADTLFKIRELCFVKDVKLFI